MRSTKVPVEPISKTRLVMNHMSRRPFGTMPLSILRVLGGEHRIQTAAVVLPVVVILMARGNVAFSYRDPELTYSGLAAISLIFLGKRLPLWVWLWWALGALTLAWSLAPGNSYATSLWEITYLAAFAAAVWLPAFWIVATLFLYNGLFDQIVLNAFSLQQFVSGSVHYVAGAQALVLVPLLFAQAYRVRQPALRILLAVAAGLSTYSALISGARAVYLPLAIVFALGALRFPWHARLNSLRRLGIILSVALTTIVMLEAIQPSRPMITALGIKASAEAQSEASGQYGVFSQRLRFIDQAFSIAVEHPFGTGIGSYPSIVHSFQKYPMLWSNSPHNYYIETVATGGWLRLLLLIALIAFPVWKAWNSRFWPWALGAAGIWSTFAFDVTSYYPSVMMFAFITLGAAHFVRKNESSKASDARTAQSLRPDRPVYAWFALVPLLMGLWWFLPCKSNSCFLSRHLGAEYLAADYFESADPTSQASTISELRELYPKSLWVVRLEQRLSEDAIADLRLAAEIAERFPLQTPDNYLDWAEAALVVGDTAAATRAIETGLAVFGPDAYPYAEARMTPEKYAAWLQRASEILAYSASH